MTTPTPPRGVSDLLRSSAAQALWKAMFDDDDLAEMYAQVAIVSALTKLRREMPMRAWKYDTYWQWVALLEEARIECERQEADFAHRFERYAEPPF